MASPAPVNESGLYSYYTVVCSSLVAPGRPNRTAVLAHVPFDFVAGDTLLGAGPYALEPCGISGMMAIRHQESNLAAALVQVIKLPDQPVSAPGKLLFYCRGNRYFLAQILACVGEQTTQ